MAKILIAENELALREFVARGLEQRRHKVTMAQDGSEALEHLKKTKYDLLLTDIDMPIMDGIALALKGAKDYPKLRILMMTGYAAEKARAHNLDMLIHDVVLKPFTLDELNHRVDSALGTALARR